MPRFSEERKSAVLKKLLPPHNRSVPGVAREEGISEQTLYLPFTTPIDIFLKSVVKGLIRYSGASTCRQFNTSLRT